MNESTSFSESDDLAMVPEDDAKPASPHTQPFFYAAEGETGDGIGRTEELPPLTIPGVKRIISGSSGSAAKAEVVIHFARRCDIGARDRNEDSCIAFATETGGHFTMMPFGLYIVADGMGGHTNGHVASKIASRQAANHILKEIYLPLLAQDTAPQIGIRDTLVEAVQIANTAVYQDEPDVDSGTTLTVALLLGNRLHVAHVGDSRLYLHTDEKLEAITNDHSLVQRLQDVGQLTPEEATVYRYRNVLLRAVGQGEEVEIDTYMRLLPKKGKLLLCSDGLCGFVSDDVINSILNEDKPIQQMVDDLYNAAIAANSNDNITVIVVEFSL
ncbi:MAG: serine/threonine-protein phosphatase [Anaerolineae bacterium]|nr:serine/threonine-protein phosphatase [Anaerolineae bacterium]